MIKMIDNNVVDISDEEYEYYEQLEKVFGKNVFANSFRSNADGRIMAVTPSTTEPTSLAIIFFLLNLSMNQRLRDIDMTLKKIDDLSKRITELENR